MTRGIAGKRQPERSPCQRGQSFFRVGVPAYRIRRGIPGQMNPEIELLHLSRMLLARGGVNFTIAPANTIDSRAEAF